MGQKFHKQKNLNITNACGDEFRIGTTEIQKIIEISK